MSWKKADRMENEFLNFLTKTKKSREDNRKIPSTLLAIDPGETSGWALFVNGDLRNSSTIEWTAEYGWDPVIEKIIEVNPDIVVCEEYRIYSGKRLAQAYSAVETVRIIGAIEFICRKYKIRLVKQMASGVKGFCNNDRLKKWGYYIKNRHARDAVRHGCYYLLFGKE